MAHSVLGTPGFYQGLSSRAARLNVSSFVSRMMVALCACVRGGLFGGISDVFLKGLLSVSRFLNRRPFPRNFLCVSRGVSFIRSAFAPGFNQGLPSSAAHLNVSSNSVSRMMVALFACAMWGLICGKSVLVLKGSLSVSHLVNRGPFPKNLLCANPGVT